MSSSRVDLVNLPLVSIPTSTSVTGITSTTSTTGVGGASPTRLNLFANSGYDGSTSVSLDNGQTLSLPTLSEGEQAQVNALFGGLNPDQQVQLSDASRKLAQALYAQVGYNPQALQSSTPPSTSPAAVTGITSASAGVTGSTTDASSLVQAAFAKALKQTSSIPSAAQNDANNMADDDGNDDDNSWAGGLQSTVPQQQQLPSAQSSVASLSVAGSSVSNLRSSSVASQSTASSLNVGSTGNAQTTPPPGLASTSSGLGSGTASTGVSVSIATPAVVSNINSAGNQYNNATGNQNYDKTVQAVSFMGMLGLQGDLTTMANQVQANVNMQNQSRTDLADVRQAIANWPDGTQTEHFTWTSYDAAGRPVQNSQDLNLQQAQALQSNLEDQLTSQADMNQEQQLKLQDVTQKYQEAINTISNLLKYEHDTVKAIIQNIHT